MQKINIDIYIGDTADIAKTNKLPAGITSYNPYITWVLPPQIQQARVGIKITNIYNQQLYAVFKSVTTANYYQISIGNGLNNKWNGLCFIQIQVSRYIDYTDKQQFQFTSGGRQQNYNGYFVIDNQIQSVASDQAVSYVWQKSIDQNIQQQLIYHLQVSQHPLFNENNLVLSQTSIVDVSSGFVDYKSIPLDVGNYFFRVRAFDGYDYSQWSDINCFSVKDFEPPKITNFSYEITYNQSGDVIVNFDVQNKSDDYTTIILYYSYADDLATQYPCILKQTSHIVPNGKNQLVWQTSKNASGSSNQLKMQGMQKTNIIQNVDLFLYIQPYYKGMYGQLMWLDIHLDNQRYSSIVTSTSNVSYQYMFRTNLMRVPIYSTHQYVGWNSDYYYTIKNNAIYIDKQSTSNYKYYKQYLSSVENLLQNNTANRFIAHVKDNPKIVEYVGWNSDVYQYISNKDNIQILTNGIVISSQTYKDYQETGIFVSNYYSQYLERFGDKLYKKQNYKGIKVNVNIKQSFSLYVDGRTFRGDDESQYTIKQYRQADEVDAWVFSNGTEDNQKEGISVVPSYFKDTMYNPIFPQQFKLPKGAQSGTDKNGNKFQLQLKKLNWRYSTKQGDWNFTTTIENNETNQSQQVYIKVFGGSLQEFQQKDQNLKDIIKRTIDYKQFYQQTSKYGKVTFADGELIFEDNKTQSPQYTMYPQYYDNTGYPICISQLYWKNVKLKDLYIRKYNIVKAGCEPLSGYGYKNFTVVPSNGIYHCYFTNKVVPQLLKLKENCFYDQFNKKCYQLVIENIYRKTDNRYEDLPQFLVFHKTNNQQQLWCFKKQLQLFKKINNDALNSISWQRNLQQMPLYFLTYQRKYITNRGFSPQLGKSCWNCEGSGKLYGTETDCYICKGTGKTIIDEDTGKVMKLEQTPFCNVAVPQYIPSVNGVYSANGFNGKQSAFNLVSKFKRDARRYIVGHHYDWGNKQNDPKILQVLNDFKQKYYPQFEIRQYYRNVVIGFKYKWLQEGQLLQVKQKKYLYVPVNTEGQIKYAWFQDKSKDTFKVDWSVIDNDDYIFLHRDTIQPQFKLTQGGFKTKKSKSIISQGTKSQNYFIKDQGYYSDKSKYGLQSYYIQGELSDYVTQTYKKDSVNQFMSVGRTIFLNHKNVIKDSIKITYIDDFGRQNRIYSYSFHQSTTSYNSYIVLVQNYSYINKQLNIQYKYYVYDNYVYNLQENNSIRFATYNDFTYLPTSRIIQDTVKVYYETQQSSSTSQTSESSYNNLVQIDKKFYQVIQNQNDDNSTFRLLFYYRNIPIKLNYNYKNKVDIELRRYLLSQLVLQGGYYNIYGINSQIILNTVKLNCLNDSQRLKQIVNYSNNYGVFYIDVNSTQYKNQILKPIQIQYYYTLIKKGSFNLRFSNFVAYLLRMWVNVDTINIYYQLQNGINVDVTEYFDFYSGDIKVTSGQRSNVKLVVNTKNTTVFGQLFSNVLYVQYDGYTQLLYLQLPQLNDQRFDSKNGYNHKLYYITLDQNNNQQQIQLPTSAYNIDGYRVSLISQNYISIINYIDVPIVVKYDAIVKKHNVYNSVQDSITVTQNQQDSAQTANKILLNNQFKLQYQNIQQFSCYYLNQAYVLQKVDESYYVINKQNGVFVPKNNFLIGKKIFFVYNYKQFVYSNVIKSIKPYYLTQQFEIDKDVISQTLQLYYQDSEMFANNFSQLQQVWNLDIDKYTNYRFFYEENETNVYLNQNQYVFQNGSFILTQQRLLNITIFAQRNVKLKSSDYIIQESKILFSNSNVLGKEIVIGYQYLSSVNIKTYNNNVLCETNNQVVLTQQKIKEKQSYINNETDQDGNKVQYYNYNVDYDIIDNWKIYYCDDNCSIQNFTFDKQNGCLKLLKPINEIQQYVQLQYSIYEDVQFKHQQIVSFNYYDQTVLLQKHYVYNLEATYDVYKYILDQNNKEQKVYDKTIKLNQDQYTVNSDLISTIKMNNNLLKKQLFVTYQQYAIEKQQQQIQCDKTNLFLTDKYLVQDSVIIKFQRPNSQIVVLMSQEHYSIINIQGNYYLQIDDSFFYYYNGSILFVQFEYKYTKFNQSNKNIHYIKFESYDRVIELHHKNVDSVSVSYKIDKDYYQLPTEAYTFTKGEQQNGSITLKSDVMYDKYLNKMLSVTYITKNQSQLTNKQIKNDMSLVFTDKDSYVVMSNSFVDRETFQLYYEDKNGLFLMPKQDYILDTGSQFFNAVIVLNQNGKKYKQYLNKRLEIKYKYIKNPRKIFNPQNQKFPYLDYIYNSNIRQGFQKYVSGYLQTQHIGYHVRPQPVYQGDQGIRIKSNVKQYSDYGQYQFLFLQSFWDAYNTIHIGGMLDRSTRIILQYAPNGTPQKDEENWKDFVGVGSTFDKQLNHYIMPPLTYDMYVDTFDDTLFKQGIQYRLRLGVRGSTASSTGSSQWVYSIPFTIDHDSVNPCNIVDIQYNNWTKRLTVMFRIDDTQGDLYDITGMAYTTNGKQWFDINLSDLSGRLQFLQSNKRNVQKTIIHKIVWKTGRYNLKPSSTYRIKIVANYTKYTQGDRPVFQWVTSMNPLLDYYQSKLTILQGGKQYYKFVRQTTRKIQNADGTISYQQLDQPLQYWQRIKPYQRIIKYNVLDQNGQPLLDQNGEIITQQKTQTVDYYISQGEINQLNTKLQNIRNKPYKTIVQDGNYVTVPWGYRQYYNQDMTQCINIQGYNLWLRGTDQQYGQQRGQLIQILNTQIQQKTLQVKYYSKEILFAEMNVRRNLIRQGFYSNGFLNNVYNESDPTPFRFRLFIKPLTQSQKEYMKDCGISMYQIKYEYQLDFYDTFDSQFNHKPLRSLFSYNINGIANQIVAGMDQQSTSSLYQGYFLLQKQKQPGKLLTDELPIGFQNYSHSYFWRVRPFTQLNSQKKQIARCKIKNIQKKSNQIVITFIVSGQQQLGSLNLQKQYYYYIGDRYHIYLKQKNQLQNDIKTMSGRKQLTDYEWEEQQGTQILIQTQRLRDQSGRVLYFQDYFKNWISFSPKRQRPCMVIWQNEYYLFYDKPNVLSQNTMYLSLSKDGNTFGQYSQIYPYNPNESLKNFEVQYLKNGFVMRKDDKFIMFVQAKHPLQTDSEIYILQSDYTGDNWSEPKKCSGLTNCTYPSVIITRVVQSLQQGQIVQSDMYLMLCQKNSNFQFYFSFDLINWESMQFLPTKYTIKQNVDFKLKINKNNVVTEIENQQTVNYYSPYLFRQSFTDELYVYFGTYDSNSKKMNVYRTKYNNGWGKAQLIVQNGFNPCVVTDYYYGNELHRVYFNTIKQMKYNGKMTNDYVINNVFIHNFNEESQLEKIQVSRITSNQIKQYSLDNITAGSYCKCNRCYGSGIYKNQQCTYCRGKGYIDWIEYQITIPTQNIPGQFDKFDYFIKLNKNYNTKLVRKYGDWYDGEASQLMSQIMKPQTNYKFLDV